jgi:hypothetical protein
MSQHLDFQAKLASFSEPLSVAERKKLWGTLVWQIRDYYRGRRNTDGSIIKISAKIDAENNRAILSGFPEEPKNIIVEFTPSQFDPSELRILSTSGYVLGKTRVPNKLPWSKLVGNHLKMFARTLDTEIDLLRHKVRSTPPREKSKPLEEKPQALDLKALWDLVKDGVSRKRTIKDNGQLSFTVLVPQKKVFPSTSPLSLTVTFTVIGVSENREYYAVINNDWPHDSKGDWAYVKMPTTKKTINQIAMFLVKAILKNVDERTEKVRETAQKKFEYDNSREGIIERVKDFLGDLRYGPAGRASSIDMYTDHMSNPVFEVDPIERTRLDHYGLYLEEDEDGEMYEDGGWDEDGWDEEYAQPIIDEITPILKQKFGDIFDIDVGEKGHITITLTKMPEI